MDVFVDENGCWKIRGESTGLDYEKVLIEYLGIIHPLFCQAKEISEFDYLHTLLGIRSMEDAGWNPFKSTTRIIRRMRNVCEAQTDYESQANLGLWIYGHIIEASEPYEIVMNLLNIINNDRFSFTCFPPEVTKKGKQLPVYPWQKQDMICEKANHLGIMDLDKMYNNFYDGRLRNAIFHSDYTIHGDEVRIMSPIRSYSREEIGRLINNALAYLECIEHLVESHLEFYKESVVIPAPLGFSANSEAKVRVIVREGEGAIGLMTELTKKQVSAGYIRAKLIRFYPEEEELVERHVHTLPPRPKLYNDK